jgi:hypothetical protein
MLKLKLRLKLQLKTSRGDDAAVLHSRRADAEAE